MVNLKGLIDENIALLSQLIEIRSVSREEHKTADKIYNFLEAKGFTPYRKYNNVMVTDNTMHPAKPTILLNSHHDTVKPSSLWTRNPFKPEIGDGKLYGLGSNDAGGPLITLLTAFLYLSEMEHPEYNLVFLASAEEEMSGSYGMEAMIEELGDIDFAIVGEPTNMEMHIAEKGLLVLDCIAHGKAGHAARGEGVNAIYKAADDIMKIRKLDLPKKSDFLGKIKMTVSQIKGGYQHNVIPDSCAFVLDIRTNEHYSNRELQDLLSRYLYAEVKARSLRLNSSSISQNHPVVLRGLERGLQISGSPTLSDQALIPFPSFKIGPGDSARSHTADEYIYISEIEDGISRIIGLLYGLRL